MRESATCIFFYFAALFLEALDFSQLVLHADGELGDLEVGHGVALLQFFLVAYGVLELLVDLRHLGDQPFFFPDEGFFVFVLLSHSGNIEKMQQ